MHTGNETASHIICDCEALATLRSRHEGQNYMKPVDLEEISVSRLLHKKLSTVELHGSLLHPPLLYSTLMMGAVHPPTFLNPYQTWCC